MDRNKEAIDVLLREIKDVREAINDALNKFRQVAILSKRGNFYDEMWLMEKFIEVYVKHYVARRVLDGNYQNKEE